MKYSEYKERLKKYKRLAKEHKVKMFYAKVSATILTLIWLVLVVVVIAAFTGCSKPAVVYKTKEVNIPVRCDIEMPALPNIEEAKTIEDIAIIIAKSFEEHRAALLCCIKGACE